MENSSGAQHTKAHCSKLVAYSISTPFALSVQRTRHFLEVYLIESSRYGSAMASKFGRNHSHHPAQERDRENIPCSCLSMCYIFSLLLTMGPLPIFSRSRRAMGSRYG